MNVISAGLACLGAALAALPVAYAQGGKGRVYTIGNYPVEAREKDAVAAKAKAHADGQQAALGSLFKRIVPVTHYNALARLKQASAAQYVDGVSVRSERNSSTQYIASLDFAFQPDAVRNLLQSEGVPFVDEQAPVTVLVPVLSEGGSFRPASGPWSTVWRGLDLDNSLTPLRIEGLSPQITPKVIGAAGTGDRALSEAYKGYAVLAIAEVDAAAKRVEVTVAGEDAAGPFRWTRSYRLQDGDVPYTMELAAVVTLGVLEGRWKAAKTDGLSGPATAGGFGQGSGLAQGVEIALEVEFSGLDEWNDLRGRLLDMPGVDDIRVGTVSPRKADVSLRYPGGGPMLAEALAQQGLSMTSAGGSWRLRSGY